jgi:hypothetical protein
MLGQRDIPFVRFPASAQWAGDWLQVERDPMRYWSGLDALFAAAEQNGVRLVPSVFWNSIALAAHCGESMQAWLDPRSRTHQYASRHVEAFASRYDKSPALMFYEFTNELNTWIDLPNVLSFWPKRDPTLPDRQRSEGDRLTTAQLRGIAQSFADMVRACSRKPISMGSDIPRGNAWHLAHGSWDIDSTDEFVAQFREITPPEMSVLSMHIYPQHVGQRDSVFSTLGEALAAFTRTAHMDGRTSFLGEFGTPRDNDRAVERRNFTAMLDAIYASNVQYAALWNYSTPVFQRDWDVSTRNDRAYQLDALTAANRH